MRPSRLIALAAAAGIVAAGVAGCAHDSGTPTSSGTSTSSGTPTSSGTTTAGQSASPSKPQASAPAPPGPESQAKGSAGGIDVTISAQDPATVRPGGAPMRFSVTLVNTTTGGFAKVGMVVSLGHCSCSPPGAMMMPAGSMRMLDPDTKAWVSVPYVREGTGMDYISRTLVPPFVLEGGQTITYQLEMQLDAKQGFTVGKGESAVNVTMTNVTTNTAIGVSPTASLPIAVEP